MGLDQAKQYVTTGHTLGKWFGRFMIGSCMRMGMICRQNEALTSALAMAVCAEAETQWHSPIGDNAREELEDMVVFILAAFGAGLRGEEVPLILLDGLLTFWDESRLDEDSHVMLTVAPGPNQRCYAFGPPFQEIHGMGAASEGQPARPRVWLALPGPAGCKGEVWAV